MPEAIPELVYVIGLFFAIVGYITARGLLATWTHSLGFVFRWLAVHLRISTHLPVGPKHIDLGGPFRVVDSWAVTALQNWCDGAEIQMAYCLHGMAKVALYTAQAIDFLTRETVHAFERLNHVKLRQFLKLLALPVLLPLLLPKLLKAILPHVTHGTLRIVHAVTHEVTHTFTRVVRYAVPHALPSPWAFPRFRTSWRELEAWRHLTAKRLARLEALLAASGLALAVAKLWGVKPSCLRRGGNIGRFMRGICGLDRALLDLLLLGAVEAFIATDLCAFSNLLIKQAEAIRPALMDLVDVEDALIGCHGTTKPRLFVLLPATLPPLQGVSPLAA